MTDFMMFWKLLDEVLKSRGLAQMNFGEARGWWLQSGLGLKP
jgi:hypothetical protein